RRGRDRDRRPGRDHRRNVREHPRHDEPDQGRRRVGGPAGASKGDAMPRPRRRRRWTRWAALGVAVLLALLYYRPVRGYMHTHHPVQVRTAEVTGLEVRKHQLQERLSEIERGATLVRGARRLGLVKPGEHLYIVQGIQEWRRAHARR